MAVSLAIVRSCAEHALSLTYFEVRLEMLITYHTLDISDIPKVVLTWNATVHASKAIRTLNAILTAQLSSSSDLFACQTMAGTRVFSIAVPTLWNSLPDNVK